MTRIASFAFAVVAVFVVTACDGRSPAHKASAASAAAMTQAAPTKDALVALEESAYGARNSRDATFWETFLSDKFVGYGASGRLHKASATMEYANADCELASYTLSDEQVKPLGDNAALITYKATVDGTCGGAKVPASSWVASAYVRDGDEWKGVFHAVAPIVDPKATLAEPAATKKAPGRDNAEADPADRNANTDAMLAAEKLLWEAWRTHNGEQIGNLTASEISFINIFGTYFATKADALKDWTGAGCNVRTVSVSNAAGTMLSPTVGILTFMGTADGNCYGQEISSSIWGTSVYENDGSAWKWVFGINLPSRS